MKNHTINKQFIFNFVRHLFRLLLIIHIIVVMILFHICNVIAFRHRWIYNIHKVQSEQIMSVEKSLESSVSVYYANLAKHIFFIE